MTQQGDLFGGGSRRGWRSGIVERVRGDFRDLAGDPAHAGMVRGAELAAHNAWALAQDGDRRGSTEALAELRKWYAQADEVRRAAAVASGGGTLASVLALAQPAP